MASPDCTYQGGNLIVDPAKAFLILAGISFAIFLVCLIAWIALGRAENGWPEEDPGNIPEWQQRQEAHLAMRNQQVSDHNSDGFYDEPFLEGEIVYDELDYDYPVYYDDVGP